MRRPAGVMALKVRQLPGGEGTAIGDFTDMAGLAAAFDGTLSQSYDALQVARKTSAATGYSNSVGKTWRRSTVLTGAVVYAPSDYAVNILGGTPNMKLQGSKNGSAWTDLSGVYVSPAANKSVALLPTSWGSYLHHRVVFDGTSYVGQVFALSEIVFFGTGGA
jgi:hypothetical protein